MALLDQKALIEFQNNGYLIIPNLFDATEIQNLLRSVECIYNDINESSLKQNYFKDGARIVFENSKLHRVVWCGALDCAFTDVGKDPRIIGPISQLLNHSSKLVQLINQLHFKMPNDGVAFDYHQDAQHRSYGTHYWNDILGNGSFVQTALALDPMTLENGPLEFFTASHHEGYLGGYDKITEEVLSRYSKVTLELTLGSLAIFHPFVIHGSAANRSSSPRRVLINGYTIPGVNSFKYPGCGKGLPIDVEVGET